MRTIHQGPRAPSPDSQAEYTQAIRPRYLPFFENALAFGGSPYTGLGRILSPKVCSRHIYDMFGWPRVRPPLFEFLDHCKNLGNCFRLARFRTKKSFQHRLIRPEPCSRGESAGLWRGATGHDRSAPRHDDRLNSSRWFNVQVDDESGQAVLFELDGEYMGDVPFATPKLVKKPISTYFRRPFESATPKFRKQSLG